MKKIVLLSILSGLLWTACTKQETLTYTPGEDEVSSSFMAVSIVSAGAVGTRATENEDGTYTENDGTYRDGEVYENHINDALFFFFDNEGNPAKAFLSDDGEVISYSEWTVKDNSGESDHNQTVEKILSNTLVFKMLSNAAEPKKVLAVLNPTDEIKKVTREKGGLSLSELNDIVSDFEGYDNGKKNLAPRTEADAEQQGFVMSNSVYVEGEGTNTRIVSMTDCNGKFYSTQEEAEKHSVVIYVERVLARIDLMVDIKGYTLDDNTIIYPLGKVSENAQDEDTELTDQLYVRFLGWNVFDTPKTSRLIKSVDPTWTSVQLFGRQGTEPWNAAPYHRSFWAINPKGLKKEDVEENSGYRFGPFKEGKQVEDDDFDATHTWTASHNRMPEETGTYVTDYFQENAAPDEDHNAAPTTPSKVIIAAQLVNNKGESQSLARWNGEKLLTEDGLKTYLANLLNLWKQGATTATETHYTKITPEDLEFVKDGESSFLTVKLKDSGAIWYKQVIKGSSYERVDEPSSVVLETCGKENVSVWTEGYTYYYFTIRHLGEKNTDATQKGVPGEFGIVRNHIYEAHVTSVDEIGVPVFNPSEDIVTTEPTEKQGWLNATVKILSWRVVRQDYDLTW